eukprot:GEMP01021213.1.p2 GENE.GEMP01021213.1~~GEMP01021213.1.p2  ORF type:complete len:151 (+),score=24.37 GEMP01021213.1:906-1358(+)
MASTKSRLRSVNAHMRLSRTFPSSKTFFLLNTTICWVYEHTECVDKRPTPGGYRRVGWWSHDATLQCHDRKQKQHCQLLSCAWDADAGICRQACESHAECKRRNGLRRAAYMDVLHARDTRVNKGALRKRAMHIGCHKETNACRKENGRN